MDNLILEVDGERIVIDEALIESLADASTYTPEEMVFLQGVLGPSWMSDEEPTAGMIATILTTRLARGKGWDQDATEQVMTLLLAWLTDRLVEV